MRQRALNCGHFLVGLLMLPAAYAYAGAPCKQDYAAGYELQQAVYCVIVGPELIASAPYPGTPTLVQARADCARYVAKFRASGFTRPDFELLDKAHANVGPIVYLCRDGRWRVQVNTEPGWFSNKWQELPGGKNVESGFWGPTAPPMAE
jgi:hypothetical protein